MTVVNEQLYNFMLFSGIIFSLLGLVLFYLGWDETITTEQVFVGFIVLVVLNLIISCLYAIYIGEPLSEVFKVLWWLSPRR